MPRPRTITNETLLAAAVFLMEERGPAALTFAAVAKATGLAPATLVQRFHSKERLLEAALLHAWDELETRTELADATAAVTPEGAIDLLVSLSGYGDGDRFADGLLILREDFRNPRLRARGGLWFARLTMALGRRLATEPDRQQTLGRSLANQWQGAVIWWGFHREGATGAFVASELRTFLGLLGAAVSPRTSARSISGGAAGRRSSTGSLP